MSQALFAVAGLLPAAVLLRHGGVLLPVLAPILGVLLPPLACAIAADLSIYGIGGQLCTVVVGAPPALALGQTANFLTRLERGRLKFALAISAAPQVHTGVVAPSGFPESTTPTDLEASVEWVPRPRQWAFPATTFPGKLRSFQTGDDNRQS